MLRNKAKIAPLVAILAGLICIVLYLPAVQWGFINFDDPEYVLNNPAIKGLTGSNIAAMFAHTHVGWWMPLTWLSLALDYHFWGLNPAGYHLTNIILHGANTCLLVLAIDILCRFKGVQPASRFFYPAVLLLTGLFFGAHPLRVESVAWVTERKDVLNGLFVLLSLLFYLHYVRLQATRQQRGQSRLLFWISVLCFALSLMAKSVSVVFPAMLILLDWAPLGRLQRQSCKRIILEKWPFLALSALMTFFTFFFAAQSQYLVTYQAFPLAQRMAVSGNAIVQYLQLIMIPTGLSPFYVIPDPIPASYVVKAVLAALVLISAAIWGWKRTPLLTACLFCFLLPLLPVLAFFQNGDQSYADRFTYLPSIAPALFLGCFLLTGSAPEITRRRSGLILGAGLLALTCYGSITQKQLGVWASTEAFWTRVIEVEPLAISYKERGNYYHSVGRYAEAVADYTAALERIPLTLQPYRYNFYALRGESLRSSGDLAASVRDFDTAIAMHPHPVYFYHRALALRTLGRAAEAEADFRKAGPDSGPITWID